MSFFNLIGVITGFFHGRFLHCVPQVFELRLEPVDLKTVEQLLVAEDLFFA